MAGFMAQLTAKLSVAASAAMRDAILWYLYATSGAVSRVFRQKFNCKNS
jgi:hypothetical protein